MSLPRRGIAVAAVAVAALLATFALSPRSAPPANGADPAVQLDPASGNVETDDTIDVSIVITDVTDLYAASVDLTFDPDVLEVVDADPGRDGVQIYTGTFPGPSEGPGDVTSNIADNTAGTISYDFTLLEPAPPVSGSGTLATIRFRGKVVGESAVAFEEAALWSYPNQPITTASVDGEVEVADAPTNTPTPSPTPTRTPTRTPTATEEDEEETDTPEPTDTHTPRPTATPETATPRPPMQNPEPTRSTGNVAAAGAQPTPGGALPSAGEGELPAQLWRWFFLSGAVVMGLASWAFTFRFYARQKESERFWHR